MQISDFTLLPDPGGGEQSRAVARFSVQLPNMKLTGFRLRLRPDGTFISASPARDGVRVVNLAPSLYRQINQAASAAFRGLHADQHRCA
ncbi:hypothetical protein J2Y55_002149 [Bosea sp. BE125]|uniref:hypothetical protein n=1 Tax=Bosea sp. BE125 TaxID=2817909 RepID=UPI00285563F1|nr:hypothetical protein [Bosea sp. BE125]MDR6871141.1 hypothetical protein [Bosea sp. BE125]